MTTTFCSRCGGWNGGPIWMVNPVICQCNKMDYFKELEEFPGSTFTEKWKTKYSSYFKNITYTNMTLSPRLAPVGTRCLVKLTGSGLYNHIVEYKILEWSKSELYVKIQSGNTIDDSTFISWMESSGIELVEVLEMP